MARHDSPAESPLSSMEETDEFPEDAEATEVMEEEPPAKRQKLLDGSTASSGAVQEPEPGPDSVEDMSDVSDDTDGDIPSSPVNARPDEDDFQEQITICAWEGCKVGDLKNMDKLVEHIHNDHIEGRQKKYTCEWVGCSRKSMPHASGYALKAHMRSHTREKPFYCYLPECDRAFTRSDALAKHMRTVHETEALRPSDPVPKSMQSSGPSKSKLKIIIKTPQSHATGQDDTVEDGSNAGDSDADMFTPLQEDQGFNDKEITMPLKRLHKLCRLQVKWAEKDGEELLTECKRWEALYKQEWLEKEVLLDQVVRSEQDHYRRRMAVLSGELDVKVTASATNDASTDAEETAPAANGTPAATVEDEQESQSGVPTDA